MYREWADNLILRPLAKCFSEMIQEIKTINFGLQIKIYHGIKALQIRIHNHDRHVNSSLAQFNTFIGIGHCKIIHTLELEDICNFKTSTAIRESLYHGHDFSFGFNDGAVIIQIMSDGIKIYFQYRFVILLL